MSSLISLYAQLQRFAEYDTIAFKSFVDKQADWEVLVGETPKLANQWVSLNMVTPMGRVPLWIKYIGYNDEVSATERLVEEYKKERERLNLSDAGNPTASRANNAYKVGLYIPVNAVLPVIATQSRWYMFLPYLIVMILLWIYSGSSNKNSLAVLWIMRIIAVLSVITISIHIIA